MAKLGGLLPIAGATAALVAYQLFRQRRKRRGPPPAWFTALGAEQDLEEVHLPEWDNGPAWRAENGFKGSDYAHGPDAAVHICGYYLRGVPGGVGSKLIGAVHFGPGAESHRGLCHGGTMCTVMDDVIGWTGFCSTGVCVAWSGFTVQINTKLSAPVKVDDWLRVDGTVTSVEGRKVRIAARLITPAIDGKDEVIHCEADGLVVLKKKL